LVFEDVFDSSKEKEKRKRKENATEIGVEFERYMVILSEELRRKVSIS